MVLRMTMKIIDNRVKGHCAQDEYFMRIALQEAKKAYEAKEIPVGAVITFGNRLIAKAHNQVERLIDATAHAEMLALSAAFNYIGGKYLSTCTLYITLEPCLMCAQATYWSQLGRLVIGAANPRLGYSTYGIQALHPRTKTCMGICAQESRYLLQAFFMKLRK